MNPDSTFGPALLRQVHAGTNAASFGQAKKDF
jgi:hypothetical protein